MEGESNLPSLDEAGKKNYNSVCAGRPKDKNKDLQVESMSILSRSGDAGVFGGLCNQDSKVIPERKNLCGKKAGESEKKM